MARSNRLLLKIALLLLLFPAGCASPGPESAPSMTPADTAQPATVALYSDRGCWDESVQAAERMFQWMGHTVTRVSAERINDEGLDGFDILCIPGGDMYRYSLDISSAGKETVRGFVREGGGYIGICGGAYFAGEKVIWRGDPLPMTPLGIFPGTAKGPINEIIPYPDYAMCQVKIVDSTHPITRAEPNPTWMLYYWGPSLTPNEDATLAALGQYDHGEQPMMFAFAYGRGRVFLISTHPEIEEDSARDGVFFAEDLDDQGSDWELMKQAVLWCLGE